MHSPLGFIASVLWALLVTHFLCAKELFHHLFHRKQKSLKGKVVVVTGAGHGLGRGVARELGRQGARVVVWDADRERAEETVWEIRRAEGRASVVVCDVRERGEVAERAEGVRRDVGEVDVVVSCVGVYPVQEVLSWKAEELYELFDTNVMAQMWVLQAFVPHMIRRKSGHFVAISSAAAIATVANEVPYSMTKSALSALMDGFMQELRMQNHEGVKVTTVHPYYTACRDDIPVKFDLRFGRLSPDYVSKEIVKGIRQEVEVMTVPRFMLFWINFIKLLPYSARVRWRDIFYTRVFPTDNSANLRTPDGRIKNIVEQFKLPPLKKGGNRKPEVAITIQPPSRNDAPQPPQPQQEDTSQRL